MPDPAYQPGQRPRLRLRVLAGVVAVCRCEPSDTLPAWVPAAGPLTAITRTHVELSIVCAEGAVPAAVRAERGFRVLEVQGPLAFDVVGVMAALTGALARAGISLLAISTFDTDYVLVRAPALDAAIAALRADGHGVDEGCGTRNAECEVRT